jgi:predicted short-subunit dehydrogenase-like oxidoreductase (DUF2520 family)
MYQYNISFIGAGRVAASLCREVFNSGYKIDLIISENEINGNQLASSCNAHWSSKPEFSPSTNVIFVAVPDHKLISVLSSIICNPDTVVAHTAGSFGLDIFPEEIKNKGVFYPLQTFSKNRHISFRNIPLLLESSDEKTLEILNQIAVTISTAVYQVETQKRRMLHLAAVFVNNFTNHMLVQGKEIASKAGYSFEILKPLIQETIAKALDSGPENSQTGPAVRNDKNTIEKHLELLSYSPELQEIYEELTSSIIKHYKKSEY